MFKNKKIALGKILLLIFLVFGIVESILRIDFLWNWFSLYNYKVSDKSVHCYDDRLIAIRLCPNLNQKIDHPLGFSFTLTTNPYGNRLTSNNQKKNVPQNKNPIWAIGDSLTMGWGVNDEESFPFLLSNHGWNVVNLASDSIGSKDVLKILKSKLQRTTNNLDAQFQKPQAIVWMFSRSDFQDDSSYKQPKIVFQLGKYSRILIMVRSILEKIRLLRGSNDYTYNAQEENFIPPNANHPTWKAIDEIKKLVDGENIELILIIAPDWKFKNSPPNYDSDYFKYIKSQFKILDYRILDMTEDYKKDPKQDFYLTNDGHPNAYANWKIANKLNLELKINKRL